MARKKKHPEHANHERWLVSYADFITLLFAFFVVMYALSQVDLEKLASLRRSMHSAFEVQVLDGSNPSPSLADGILEGVRKEELIFPDKPVIVPAANPAALAKTGLSDAEGHPPNVLEKVEADLKTRFSNINVDDKIKLKAENRGWIISLTERTFFNSGEAEMKPDAMQIIDSIASTILQLPNQIRIEGHTDNTPIHTERFPSNWELSTARATFVINYFINRFNFEPKRLAAAGYGEYHPIADNTTPEGRAENRRVDIVLLSDASAEQEPK